MATESRDEPERRDRKLSLRRNGHRHLYRTHLGGYGIEHFTAVINSPEAAILAVGAQPTNCDWRTSRW
ncbi:2-oxo acid dehydrogenase subunit E2 [Nocardia donostiensis]|uniref:2-oxo acid dehydrogenase subunit E2 n=1 Tax=Nocardia donostiensis TaxID=1538463 RepID=UPI0009DB4FF5